MKQQHQPSADELASSCFHHKDKNCKLAWFGYRKKDNDEIEIESIVYYSDEIDALNEDVRTHLKRAKCKTHNVIVCHCGWQIGLHDGTMSAGYDYDSPLLHLDN